MIVQMWVTTPILMTTLLISEQPRIPAANLERAAYQMWYDKTKLACNWYRGRLDVIWDRRTRSATAECVISDKVKVFFHGFRTNRVP